MVLDSEAFADLSYTPLQHRFLLFDHLSLTLSVLHYSKQKSTVSARLRCVACVLRSDGSLVTPDQCYDPSDPLLSRLLSGEELFPDKKFCQANIIDNLKLLGKLISIL